MPQHELIDVFIEPLEKAQIRYMVTGAVAAIFYGEPRLTHDIDIVIHLEEAEVPGFCSLFPQDSYYCPPHEIIYIELRRKTFAHFNLIHHMSGLKADCYPFGDDELHEWAFRHKKLVSLVNDKSLWLAPIEYVILRKLQYYREGASQKHCEDIRKMMATSGDQVDNDYLANMVAKLDLQKYWEAFANIR